MKARPLATGYDELDVDWLRARGSIKWRLFDHDVIPAWVAEMDYPTAEPIRAALRDALDRDFVGYLPHDLDTGLPAATCAWLASRDGPFVEPAQVRLIPDVMRGIELAIDVLSRPNSPVVLPTPCYPPFYAVLDVCRRERIEVPMVAAAARPELDLTGIDDALAHGAGSVLLCNPHNPLGRVFDRDELACLAEIVQARGAKVISDEIHAPLTYPETKHVPYATVSDAAAAHSVTVVSASKAWNLAGLKSAQLLLTNLGDVKTFESVSMLRTHGTSTLGAVANLAAYRDGADWLADTSEYLDGNRRLLGELLANKLPELTYHPPEGTYLAWLDCEALGLRNPSEFFLQRARVGLNDGAEFGDATTGYVRLNFATSREILTRVVERMATAVAELRGDGVP